MRISGPVRRVARDIEAAHSMSEATPPPWSAWQSASRVLRGVQYVRCSAYYVPYRLRLSSCWMDASGRCIRYERPRSGGRFSLLDDDVVAEGLKAGNEAAFQGVLVAEGESPRTFL
jgi:hypothetical protein